MSCLSNCCKTGEDEGEWIEPFKEKRNGGSRRPTAMSGSGRRASVKWERLRDHVLDDHSHSNKSLSSQQSVRWADLIENLDVLDDDKRCEEGRPCVERGESDEMAAELADTLGKKGMRTSRLTMGSWFKDDSIIRGLGGFHHSQQGDSDSISDVEDGESYKRQNSDGSKSSPLNGDWKPKRVSVDSTITNMSRASSTKSTESTVSSDSSPSWSTRLKKRMTTKSAPNLSSHELEGTFASGPKAGNGVEDSFKKKRMTLLKFQNEAAVSVGAMKGLFKRSIQSTIQSNARSAYEKPKLPAVTSIAVLSDGYFLAASLSGERTIKMYRSKGGKEGGRIELVREFEGHKSGITALATLDCKGRFLSAGMDKTVRLWDSRFNIGEDYEEEEDGVPQHKPMILLATFDCFERLIYSIQTITEGSYVRPTDDIDMAMVAAMAKKTAFEGAAAVQQAAIQREIIECSGSFATLSRNDKKINMWEMTVADKNDEDCPDGNCSQIKLGHQLEHEASIGAMAGRKNIIIAGDIMGVVVMWKRARRTSFGSWGKGSNNWMKTHKFTPWKPGSLNTPTEISKQSILKLCLLNSGTFVSGSKNGTIRVWDNIDKIKEFEVYKKRHAHSMKVTSELVSGIQQLPPVTDPNTGEECLAFSVGSTDGHVMSMALYPRSPGEKKGDQLVMFHVYDNCQEGDDDDSKEAAAVESIAVSGTVSDPVVVAGDCDGGIKTLNPTWKSIAIC